MPLYDYKCRSCGYQRDEFIANRADKPSSLGMCVCGKGELKPVFSVQLAPVMQPHYNPSVDAVVSDMGKYKDMLKRASEAHSLRTGLDCNFVPADRSALGATDEGLESTNALRRSRGLPPVSNLS